MRGKIEANTLITTTVTIPRTTARSSMFTPLRRIQQCTQLDRTEVVAVADGGDGLHAGQSTCLRLYDLMA
jgi:hypothetical protein